MKFSGFLTSPKTLNLILGGLTLYDVVFTSGEQHVKLVSRIMPENLLSLCHARLRELHVILPTT